uniref:Uncharacterized protein n=1 Tax=Anopheles coluzzii TaxID=1518534 RepID=A0A8W7PT81_ANOCL
MPISFRCSLGPTPDSISSCGEAIAPAAMITSLRALITYRRRRLMNSTPYACFVTGSISTLVTREYIDMSRLGRLEAGTSNSTFQSRTSDNRLAITDPPEPAPMMMKSYSFRKTFVSGMRGVPLLNRTLVSSKSV